MVVLSYGIVYIHFFQYYHKARMMALSRTHPELFSAEYSSGQSGVSSNLRFGIPLQHWSARSLKRYNLEKIVDELSA